MRRAVWAAAASMLAAVPVAAAQSIAARVDGVRDGSVTMAFAPRPGVCGDGHGSMWFRGPDDGYRVDKGSGFMCVAGPIRVTIGRADGQTVSVRSCVACRASSMAGTVDLGEVPAADAARYLLAVARHNAARNAENAVSGAALADAGDLSPDLARLVKDDEATLATRKQALFWLGQGDGPTADLIALYGALTSFTLREHYTFVLSQRRDDAALDKLIDIARHDSDSQVRKQAMFWLGQSKDPKAIGFFRDVLLR